MMADQPEATLKANSTSGVCKEVAHECDNSSVIFEGTDSNDEQADDVREPANRTSNA